LKPFGVIKNKREIRRPGGGFTASLPTPIKIFFGQGFGEGSLNSEYWRIISIPTGVCSPDTFILSSLVIMVLPVV
jgi:hypothetical protein